MRAALGLGPGSTEGVGDRLSHLSNRLTDLDGRMTCLDEINGHLEGLTDRIASLMRQVFRLDAVIWSLCLLVWDLAVRDAEHTRLTDFVVHLAPEDVGYARETLRKMLAAGQWHPRWS